MLQTWTTASLRLSVALSALALSALFSGGCEDAEKERCVPGETLACQGEDGCAGTRICELTGRLTSCRCDEAVARPNPPASRDLTIGCTRGATRDCLGPNDCQGVSSCNGSGTFSACRCESSSELPYGSRANVLGAPCGSNSECGTSLFCWKESATSLAGLSGGPAGGYCTARCQLQPDCAAFEATGNCLVFAEGTPGLCFAGCTTAPPDPAEAQCGARSNVTCVADAPAPALCLPTCDTDQDCPGGRCTVTARVGTCVLDTPPDAGSPPDASSSPDVGSPPDAGSSADAGSPDSETPPDAGSPDGG